MLSDGNDSVSENRDDNSSEIAGLPRMLRQFSLSNGGSGNEETLSPSSEPSTDYEEFNSSYGNGGEMNSEVRAHRGAPSRFSPPGQDYDGEDTSSLSSHSTLDHEELLNETGDEDDGYGKLQEGNSSDEDVDGENGGRGETNDYYSSEDEEADGCERGNPAGVLISGDTSTEEFRKGKTGEKDVVDSEDGAYSDSDEDVDDGREWEEAESGDDTEDEEDMKNCTESEGDLGHEDSTSDEEASSGEEEDVEVDAIPSEDTLPGHLTNNAGRLRSIFPGSLPERCIVCYEPYTRGLLSCQQCSYIYDRLIPRSATCREPSNSHRPRRVHEPPNATSFERFKELPVEIRLMIWKAALPDSRVVFVEHVTLKGRRRCTRVWSDKTLCNEAFFEGYETVKPHIWDINHGFESTNTPPAMLLASKESFGVATKQYSKAFGSIGAYPQTWFSFEHDIISLDVTQLGIHYPEISKYWKTLKDTNDSLFVDMNSDICKVQHIAITGFGPFEDLDYLTTFISFFSNLKTLTIVLHSSLEMKRDPELCLTDFCDEQASLHLYRAPYLRIRDAAFQSALNQFNRNEMEVERYLIDESKFKIANDALVKRLAGRGRTWSVPEFKYKMITTMSRNRKLEEAK